MRVVTFESRMAAEARRLIERLGCQATLAPALREAGLAENSEVEAFGRRLIAGEFEVVVFLTGVGVETLFSLLEQRHRRAELVAALRRVVTVARGPKPARALSRLKVPVTLAVPEPNTWRELLAALRQRVALNGLRVAVQEYGVSNPELLEGLSREGAQVTPLRVYRWTLPEDCGPLGAAIDSIIAGEQEVALFTNGAQAANAARFAASQGKLDALRAALRTMAVGSIGPVCSAALRAQGFGVDFEPEHPRLGHLIRHAALHGPRLLEAKRKPPA